MSGLDAAPWGFGGYGYLDYVRQNPENLVFSLARMWVERTTQLCRFVDSHPKSALALRYEDLVFNPEKTLESVFGFLDCEWDPDLFTESHIFGSEHARGRGDHKIEHAQGFRNTIGVTGWQMPRSMLPEVLKSQADKLSSRLGYPALDDVFDKPFGWHSLTLELSDVTNDLFDVLEKAVTESKFANWHFGPGVLIVRDQDVAIEVDITRKSVRVLEVTESDFSRFDFRIVTDANSIRDVLSGALGLGAAMRHGRLNLGPSAAIASADQDRLYVEVTELLRTTVRFAST